MWERTKTYSKQGFDKVWHTFDKLGAPVNRLSYKVGAEAFWPMTLDKESDKAARILRSFCKDGFYADTEEPGYDENGKIVRPKGKQRVIQKIPTKVIQQAKGLAIFTTMRTGLWLSGSGGSGILLGRIPETGEWSPPSGIMLHTAGVGFLAGVDIYDCVVVINTYEALEAFKTFRCTLGGEVSAAAGPVGIGGVLESEVHKRQAPIWTYMKSRGLYGGVQVDGTIIIERTDENERFYGEKMPVTEILAGKIKHPPPEIKTLMETVKAAQGDTNVDESLIAPAGETPGDMALRAPDAGAFGIPAADDPDPYGVQALEAEGLFIREAGTKIRPTRDTFEFRPSADSPVWASILEQQTPTASTRNSWRASVMSQSSMDRGTQTSEAAPTAPTSVSRASSRSGRDFEDGFEPSQWSGLDSGRAEALPNKIDSPNDFDKQFAKEGNENDEDFEVHEVRSATVSNRGSVNSTIAQETQTYPTELKRQSPTFTRARLVTIPKRPPPPALPPRNPQRSYNSSSNPVSPVSSSASSQHGRRRSVMSSSSHTTREILSELPLSENDPKADSAVDTSYDDGLDASHALTSEKDEFHSASSGHESENEEVNKEHVPGSMPKDEEETKSETQPWAEVDLERSKTPVPA